MGAADFRPGFRCDSGPRGPGAGGAGGEPELFFDAKTSIGSAPSRDGKYLRLVIRRADGAFQELRRLPVTRDPSFEAFGAAGNVVVWAGSTRQGEELWAADLPSGRSVRRLTAHTGDMRFYRSSSDLVIAQGRVHWVAATVQGNTEVRSVGLNGGPVEIRTLPGPWALTAWPWLVDGQASLSGADLLHNIVTGQELTVPLTPSSVTACTPVWCQVVSRDNDGHTQMELVRPDGTGRRRFAGRTAGVVITDVAVLDRFEVFGEAAPESWLTGKLELLLYDISTGRTVQISPEAADVSYRAGVLWWSTGSQDLFLRHSVDLRTCGR